MPGNSLTYRNAAAQPADRVLEQLRAAPRGLSQAEAAKRFAEQGPNEVAHQHRGPLALIWRQLASPFSWLLALAALISLATGDAQNALLILVFVFVNTGLGFFQEYRAERAAALLETYWRDTARVVRDGVQRSIPARELVVGDIVNVRAGDKIPADVRFISARGLLADESILTGESANVAKDARTCRKEPKTNSDASNIGFAGTSLLSGEGQAVVFATAANSSLGQIASLTIETRQVSAFESQIAHFSSFILKLVIVTLALVFALNIGLKGISHFEELLVFTIALTVGIIPETLPIVTTIALSNGALQLAKRKVVVKRLSAIDDLGSIDVLCTDKTGTMTENKMKVTRVHAADPAMCLRYALLAASPSDKPNASPVNAIDAALWQHADAKLRAELPQVSRLDELPFDPVRRRSANLIRPHGGETILIVRGAAESILPLCRLVEEPIQLGKYLAHEGLTGNRVIAVAVRRHALKAAKLSTLEKDLELIGFVSFRDPLKEDAVAAAAKARSLGVQIKILTGDAREVAGAVAAQLKLVDDPSDVMTGEEFDALDAAGKTQALQTRHVFARLDPKQKFTILEMLKEHATVGYIGDGFNDAPGLKIAHVAIAVAGAADIAREAADVILLEKSLMVVCDGIEEGRRIFGNVIKYLKITLASNFGNFYSVAVASLFIPYLPMLPVQILLVNLLSSLPLLAISSDHVDKEDLRRPTHYDAREMVAMATALGLVSSIFDFVVFALFKQYGATQLQTLWFVESTLTELVLIFSLRTSRAFFRSRPSWLITWLSIGIGALTIALPFLAFGQTFFQFGLPTFANMLTVLIIVLVYFLATETVKLWITRFEQRNAVATRARRVS